MMMKNVLRFEITVIAARNIKLLYIISVAQNTKRNSFGLS